MKHKLLLLALVVSGALFFAASPSLEDAGAQQPDFAAAIAAQERHTPDLLTRPGIVGTGVGVNALGDAVIRVYVTTPAVIPPQALDNVPVERVVTGRIDAQCYQDECTRPVPLGVSVGHPNITAGTIGARVKDGAGNVYILSNNHVLANSNNADIGDSALQPGPYDGGSDPADRIGTLSAFVPINFSGVANTVDAAIALTTTADASNETFSGYKPTSTPVEASNLLAVKKEGRTTGVTTGQVAETNVTVTVCYQARGPFGCSRAATFVNQFAVGGGSFSAGGDSGSLIVTQSGNEPVGLLFAGSSTRTIANRIQAVLSAFSVTIDDSDDGVVDPPENDPPTASFTFGCDDLVCTFDASASDDDGNIVSYAWDFGDDNSGNGVNPQYTYEGGGDYTVILTVMDDDGAIDTATQEISVSGTPDPGGGINLDVSGYKVRGVKHADLTWTGATSANVDVIRNGSLRTTTANDGAYTDNIGTKGGGSYDYQVCEAGTSNCSAVVTISF